MGLAGRTVTGMAFSLYDGKATWDRAGKFTRTTVATKYYPFNGMIIATSQGETLSYLHTDHLSSNSVSTNASGVETANRTYYAYGSPRTSSGTLPTDRTYTGQEQAPRGYPTG